MNIKNTLLVGDRDIKITTDGKYIEFYGFQKLCAWNLAHLYEDKEICKKIVGTDSDLFCQRINSVNDFKMAIPHHFKKEDGVQYISYSLVKHIATVEPDVVGKSVNEFLSEIKTSVILFKFLGWIVALGLPIAFLVLYFIGSSILSIIKLF